VTKLPNSIQNRPQCSPIHGLSNLIRVLLGVKSSLIAQGLTIAQISRIHPEEGLPGGIFFNPKITILVNFGGPLNEKVWYILWL
jgi:hypothetical protein